MPRRNNTSKHIPYAHSNTEKGKRRFATEQQAEAAAAEQMLLKPRLQLYVYRGIDGGWYLTRTQK